MNYSEEWVTSCGQLGIETVQEYKMPQVELVTWLQVIVY